MTEKFFVVIAASLCLGGIVEWSRVLWMWGAERTDETTQERARGRVARATRKEIR